MAYGIQVEVWGERALFTRPELSVERVSYDVITPSAALSRASIGIRGFATPSTASMCSTPSGSRTCGATR